MLEQRDLLNWKGHKWTHWSFGSFWNLVWIRSIGAWESSNLYFRLYTLWTTCVFISTVYMQCGQFSCQEYTLHNILYVCVCTYSTVYERDTKSVCVSLRIVYICTANHHAFAVFLSFCVHAPAYWQPAWQQQCCVGSLPEWAYMLFFHTDWTPPQEVMSLLTQSLPSVWGQLDAAWVIIATFTAIMWCGSAEALKGSSALPVCVGKACGKYCGNGRSVLPACYTKLLHANKLLHAAC